MPSFVPPQRRPPQITDTDAPKNFAVASDWRENIGHDSASLATVERQSVGTHPAAAFDSTLRIARQPARVPLFPRASPGDPLIPDAPTHAGRAAHGINGIASVSLKEVRLHQESNGAVAQRKGGDAAPAASTPENVTGLPSGLKSGIESLSGMSLSDVMVHYNSSRPASLGALAYTRGTEIHVGPGQEKQLPHEAWHVVQQRQGRVKATRQVDGLPVNDDPTLEYEAETMGARILDPKPAPDGGPETKATDPARHAPGSHGSGGDVAQLRTIPGKILSP
ncbi:MAG: eCIS core domain-containing protein, partial [Thermomicrobiales bacterium]